MVPRPRRAGCCRSNSSSSEGIPNAATALNISPSLVRIWPESAEHSRVAFSTSVWSTGSSSNAERLITLRISEVAVCWSTASVKERCKSAYDGAGWALPSGRRRGAPHSEQNLWCEGFSCWHRGHVIRSLPAAGAAKGRDGGPRLTARVSRGQGRLDELGQAWDPVVLGEGAVFLERARQAARQAD